MFGNNTERMAFDKSPWPLVEIMEDENCTYIYMGKPTGTNNEILAPGWYIKRIFIFKLKDGRMTIETYVNTDIDKSSWANKENLRYKYI